MVVPPNHPLKIGCSTINHPFWDTPIIGNTHIINLYFSELFQLAQHNAHSKIVSRNRADIKKPGESSEEEEEVLKAVPKASQSMVLPKAKIARQIGCGSLVVRVFSFFFKSMLKAILVNRAETPKKWDGMMV